MQCGHSANVRHSRKALAPQSIARLPPRSLFCDLKTIRVTRDGTVASPPVLQVWCLKNRNDFDQTVDILRDLHVGQRQRSSTVMNSSEDEYQI